MRAEAADAGRWESQFQPGMSFPTIQFLTASEILAGKQPELPRWFKHESFKEAKRTKRKIEQSELFGE
jgi:hypothetical protein